VTLFFYNPNIQPKEEFEKRLEAVKKLGLPLIVGDYSPEEWLKAVSGLEKEPENGKRCLICYQFRLEKTAELAKKLGFDYFSTTLNLSPYKDVDFANKTGKVSAGKYGLMYLELNLAKEERFRLSRLAHQKAKESGLYCQKYCGCLFSKK
jgi:predicted adenine nucleotide alpha hydrolase (AANH) superfamily ATPase